MLSELLRFLFQRNHGKAVQILSWKFVFLGFEERECLSLLETNSTYATDNADKNQEDSFM